MEGAGAKGAEAEGAEAKAAEVEGAGAKPECDPENEDDRAIAGAGPA